MTITWARRIRTAAAAALLLAAAVACGSGTAESGSGTSDLEGRGFEVTSVSVDGEPRPTVEGTTITITFDGGTVRAHAGCNHLGGPVTIESDRIVLGEESGSTAMGCDQPRHEQDEWLWTFLRAEPSWTLDGSTLTLEAEGTTMVLSDAADTTPAAELIGSTWVLDTIVEGGTAVHVPGLEATLVFSADGGVVGRGTCNGYGAAFEAGADRITFEPGPTTLIACPDPEGRVEDAVRATLVDTTTYAIEGQRLTITSADGSRGLVYRVEL